MARTVLITGGNRGLGLEAGRQLAERGFRVLLTSRSDGRERPEALARRGLDVSHRTLDVADPKSSASLADQLRSEGKRIDVLINNAGVALNGFNAEVARETLEVNFFGAMRVTDDLLPLVNDGGAIVMVSSGMGELAGLPPALGKAFADPQLSRQQLVELMRSFVREVEQGTHQKSGWPSSAYRVSKIGLNALTRVLAKELAPRRIRVNAVCPGWVRTDMGGRSAPRSVEEGASSIVVTAALESGPTGKWFRDGVEIEW